MLCCIAMLFPIKYASPSRHVLVYFGSSEPLTQIYNNGNVVTITAVVRSRLDLLWSHN